MSGLVESSADARSKIIGQNFRCRAWIRFNSGGTIHGSGNVSSFTRNGAGRYVVHFTKDMPDTNYIGVYTIPLSGYDDSCGLQDYQSVSVDADCSNGSAYVDRDDNCVAIFR
jgi:hypothetical protein